MSVYIKGFPLPNNCGACPLRLAWCRERIYMVTRPERCPLIPVPPHGRLVDLTEIKKRIASCCGDIDCYKIMCNECAVQIVMNNVKAAPIIFPADPTEDGDNGQMD